MGVNKTASEGFPLGPVLIGRCAMTSLHSWNAAMQEANGSQFSFILVKTGNFAVIFTLSVVKKIQMPPSSSLLSSQ